MPSLLSCCLLSSSARVLSILPLLAGFFLCLRLMQRHAAQRLLPASTAARQLQALPWKVRDATLLLVALSLPVLPTLLAAASARSVPTAPPSVWQLAMNGVFYGAILTGVWLAGRRTGLGAIAALGLSRTTARAALRTGVHLGLAMLPPVLLVAWLAENLLQGLGFPAARQNVFDTLANPALGTAARLLLILLAVILAPIAEEAVFRGVLFPTVLRRCRLPVALLLTNALFALLHLHLPSFLPLLAVGACLSLGMTVTGSLLTPIAMHAIFNAEMLLLFHAWPELAS